MEAGVFLLLFSCILQVMAIEFVPNGELSDKITETNANNFYMVNMHEEIKEPFILGYVDYTSGTQPPVSFSYPDGNANSALGLVFTESTQTPGLWEMNIEMRQNYEGSYFTGYSRKYYLFTVGTGSEMITIDLNLININDNEPIVDVHDSRCEIEENDDQVSTCTYTITDADGYMRGLTWTLSDDNDNVFEFWYLKEAENDDVTQVELVLKPIEKLDYENIALYIMEWTVIDTPIVPIDTSLSGVGNIVVSVIDMPDEPPVWSKIFAAEEFDEMTDQTFTVIAMDGDIGVKDEIFYKTDGEWSNYISIGQSTGVITVLPIDRDADGEIIYTFTVTACEVTMPTECVSQLITFLVRDLNNQLPIITVNSDNIITIPENSFQDLNLDISANDMDMGENAMYDITLDSEDGQHDAFTVAPSTGYQNSDIFIYIVNYILLDYDRDEIWREFTLTLKTKDRPDPQNEHEVVFTIILENLNDEVPEFDFGEDGATAYVASIPETVGLDEFIITVKATDADIGDSVKYSLLGTYINGILSIDDETGEIRTAITGAFDFETQEEVVLQVQATDTFKDSYESPFNSAIAQLTITVIDVNDETPRITVGSEPISIDENQKDETVILEASSNFLVASDDDQDASLTFIVNWDNSYATKTGRRISDEDFEAFKYCIEIEAVPIGTTTGKGKAAAAELTIRDVNPGNTPDFESFDILYIEVIAIDLLQEVNSDRATVILPIYILDVNDEPPVFVESTIESYKSVNEEVASETTIAIIIATDVDSDKITYSLKAIEEEHQNLVTINDLGELSVTGRIDADEPKLYSMGFIVTASDGDHNTPAEIVIYVNDINDNAPVFISPAENENFLVPEKSDDGTFIATVAATDADRDEPNNVVGYRFSTNGDSQLSNYFSVGLEDGVFAVFQRDSNYILDRDNQIPGIINTIRISAYDDGTNDARSSDIMFTVTLTDINDQIPIITTLSFSTSENVLKDTAIDTIRATDADQTGTDNSRIDFTIVSIEAANTDSKEPPGDMFVLTNINTDEGTCTLTTGVDLQTYHGSYAIVVRASDLGEPPQSEEYTITVAISMYNFYAPTFTFPTPGTTLYLRENQAINNVLFDYNGVRVPDFTATDGQGEKYSLAFSVSDSEVFTLFKTGVSFGELRLLTTEDLEIEYTITITVAPIDAVNPLTTSMDLNIRFIDLTEEPAFPQSTQTIYFYENSTDLQTAIFYEAVYNDVPEDLKDVYTVYYAIMGSQLSSFQILNNEVNEISLSVELDREEQESHEVQIQASRYGGDGSPLILTVELIDINDNPPHFEQLAYYERISTTTSVGTNILQVKATDADSTAVLVYNIVEFLHIPTIINSAAPFDLDPDNGIITSTVEIPQAGEGYFLFTIRVFDGIFENSANVHIYMVSDAHRVEFVFRNDITTVNELLYQIRTILESHFEYNVIIEQVTPNTDDDGNAMDDETIVQVYFVNSDEHVAVVKGTIEDTANDITAFRSLSDRFAEYELNLARFLDNTESTDNTEDILKAWLIGVSIVLGTLCVLLLVVFILKTRSLTKRLNKLSVIRYGSQDSGLNRKVAPTTNKHAIEGSNPAYNEEKVRSPEDDDAISVGSGDSDLVGVENNPEFDYNYETNNTNRRASTSKNAEIP